MTRPSVKGAGRSRDRRGGVPDNRMQLTALRAVADAGRSPDGEGLRSDANRPRERAPWRWSAGAVDLAAEHIELRYGSAQEADYAQWMPVAVIGRAVRGTLPVRWLIDPTENSSIAEEIRRELDFYLIDHPRRSALTQDPWEYAVYHCSTTANVYSNVHWSHSPQGVPVNIPAAERTVESLTWPFDEIERERWCGGDERLLLRSPASAFIKRVLSRKHTVRPRRFFGEAWVAAQIPHSEGYYCPFKWLTSSRWVDGNELADRDAREFREALARHFPNLSEFQETAKAAAKRLRGVKPVGPDLWLVTARGHLFVEVKLPKDHAAPRQIAGLALLATQLKSSTPITVQIISLDNAVALFEHYVRQMTG